MPDPLDVIEQTRETLRSAYKAATTDEDREAIRKKIDDLADLQENIILEQFQSEAKKIAALTDTLAKIIKDLRDRIDNLFIDKIAKIGDELAPSSGKKVGKGSKPSKDTTKTQTATAAKKKPVSSTASASGIDCPDNCTSSAALLHKKGVEFVGRYYRNKKSKYDALTVSEAAALSAAGLSVVALWESKSDYIGHFSYSAGVDEGTSAYRQALVVGQPKGTPVYFAVDDDFDSAEIAGPISDYFKGIADGFAVIGKQDPIYAIGVYGSGLVCSTLLNQSLVTFTWLAMSSGWRGYDSFAQWNIKQSKPVGDLKLNYDSDEARAGYGGFQTSPST